MVSASDVALIVPTIFFFIFLIKKWKKSGNNSMKLPPGPKTLPIIGNLHLISSPHFRCLRDLAARNGPLMYLKLGEVPIVVVSSPELAKEMLKDHDPNYADRPRGVAVEILFYGYLDIGFSPYGDYWRQMRKICINKLLSPKMVRSFDSIRRDEAARLVSSLREASGRPVNLTEKIFSFSSSITCRAAFGGVGKDNEKFIELMAKSMEMGAGFEVEDFFPSSRILRALSWTKTRLRNTRRNVDVILDDLIDRHIHNLSKMAGDSGNGEFGDEDLIDVLLKNKEDLKFPLGKDNIKAVLFDIFTAGTDTSSTSIDWAMVELLRNPNVMGKAQAEVRRVLKGGTSVDVEELQNLKYLKLVIKEIFRIHPAVPMLHRASREAREIKGYMVPAGVKVMFNVWAIHRDPSFWKDPERFEPERFENQAFDFTGGDSHYLPFGTGRRMCPGITFGATTVELALAHLLYNFDWKLLEGVKPQDLDMLEGNGLSSPRKDNLFVIATPYQPLI